MYSKQLFVLAIILSALVLNAQEEEHACKHDHHQHEIGIGNSAIFMEPNHVAFGTHVHYLFNFSHSKFGAGAGLESVFGEHIHNTVGVIGHYRPLHGVGISLMPGLVFEEDEIGMSGHVEVLYEFEAGDFHIGPVAGFALDSEAYHYSAGFHLGYGF